MFMPSWNPQSYLFILSQWLCLLTHREHQCHQVITPQTSCPYKLSGILNFPSSPMENSSVLHSNILCLCCKFLFSHLLGDVGLLVLPSSLIFYCVLSAGSFSLHNKHHICFCLKTTIQTSLYHQLFSCHEKFPEKFPYLSPLIYSST